ncbi:MAG: response regulator [Limisphaerales bacterium]
MAKLLIVEDDRIIASIYTRRFQEEGFQVDHAADGQSALSKLEEFAPDIVVLDIMLPQVNGLEILRTIREDPARAMIPVVVFSNAYQPRIIEEAWALGASEVLMKANTNPAKLVGKVNELLKRAAAASAPATPSSTLTVAPVASGTMNVPQTPGVQAAQQPVAASPRQEFLNSLPGFMEGFKSVHDTLLTTTNEDQRQACLLELSRACNGLAGTAGAVGVGMIARLAEVYHALFREMHDNPAHVTISTVRTSSQTMGFLERLVAHAAQLPSLVNFQPRIMVVEDEEISRRAALHALERAGLKADSEANGHKALMTAKAEHFDLFVLDIDIVGMSGVELSQYLREEATYANTPIVFVTVLHEYQSRVQSLGDAMDLIAKPYCFVELSLKALCYLFRAELAKLGLR